MPRLALFPLPRPAPQTFNVIAVTAGITKYCVLAAAC